MQYDDYAYLQTDNSTALWRIVTDPFNANLPTAHISTVPVGRIGINMTNPGASPPADLDIRLDVNGNIRASTVRASEMCRADGTHCIFLNQNEFFGGRKTSGTIINDCPDGQVITSIGNSRVQCQLAPIQNLGVQIRCPVTTWVTQILTNGSIVCTGGIRCPGGTGCL
jgi:hypothetical protein